MGSAVTTKCAAQIFKNNDVNPDKKIKKKRFLDEDNIAEVREYVGEGLDMEEQFDNIDQDGKGKVFFNIIFWINLDYLSCCQHLLILFPQILFRDLVTWAFKKNMAVEIANKEKKKKAEEDEEEKEEQ